MEVGSGPTSRPLHDWQKSLSNIAVLGPERVTETALRFRESITRRSRLVPARWGLISSPNAKAALGFWGNDKDHIALEFAQLPRDGRTRGCSPLRTRKYLWTRKGEAASNRLAERLQ